MGKKRKLYRSDAEILHDWKREMAEQFKPFFESYQDSKKTFFIQSLNLIFIMILLWVPISIVIDKVDSRVQGSSILAVRIFFIVLSLLLLSFVSDKKVFKWETLFCMDYEYAKKWLKRLTVLNILFYCYHERLVLKDAHVWTQKIWRQKI